MNRFTMLIGIEKDGNGNQLAPDVRARAMTEFRDRAARTFGGFTFSHAEGGWINDSGRLVLEGALAVTILTDKGAGHCRDFALMAGRLFGQHTVLMDYEPCRAVFVECGNSDASEPGHPDNPRSTYDEVTT